MQRQVQNGALAFTSELDSNPRISVWATVQKLLDTCVDLKIMYLQHGNQGVIFVLMSTSRNMTSLFLCMT